jgi:hypothetical protein
MPNPAEMLADLRAAGFSVSLRGGRVAVAPAARLTPAQVREVRRNLDALFSTLAAEEWSNAPDSDPEPVPPAANTLEGLARWKGTRAGAPEHPCVCAECREDHAGRWRDRWRDF